MSAGWKRLARPSRAGDTARAHPGGPIRDQELLEFAWEVLNVARDNKALVMTQKGVIINANPRMTELFGRSLGELIGRSIRDFLPGPTDPTTETVRRWEAMLERSPRHTIAVEVTREPLSRRRKDVGVYAIRDLRERHATAEQLQRQS